MTSLSELATKLRKRSPLVEPFQDVLEAADRLDAIQQALDAFESASPSDLGGQAGKMLDLIAALKARAQDKQP